MTELQDGLLPVSHEAAPDPATRSKPDAGPPARSEISGNGAGPPAGGNRSSALRARVRTIDERVDAWFEPYRGRPGLDGAAKVITGLGDHGFMWAATTAWRARRHRARAIPVHSRPRRRRHRIQARQFRVEAVDRAVAARPHRGSRWRPVSSRSANRRRAASRAAIHWLVSAQPRRCADQGDRPGNVLLLTAATLVGLSRLHLRAHHASDVVGGAVIGTALGLVGRRLL